MTNYNQKLDLLKAKTLSKIFFGDSMKGYKEGSDLCPIVKITTRKKLINEKNQEKKDM